MAKIDRLGWAAGLSFNCYGVRPGVVGWKGRAALILGDGNAPLIAALVRAGSTYYSDTYAVFDSRCRVHPYPSPLNMTSDQSDCVQPVPVKLHRGRRPANSLP